MEQIEFDVNDLGVASVKLARPEKRNALSNTMINELTSAADEISRDQGIRVVKLSAEGQVFSAGGDLEWMREQISASHEQRYAKARELAQMFFKWYILPKPVVARVHGNAFGGGLGLLSAADCVIAVDSTCFALTEVRLGLIPAVVSPYVFCKVGEAAARSLFYSGKTFDAATAHRIGLVSEVVRSEELDAVVETELSNFLRCAPAAVSDCKRLVRSLGSHIDEKLVEKMVGLLVSRWNDAEAFEGISAFFERRNPDWLE